MVVSRHTAHAELRYGLRFRASSQGGSGRVAQAAGPATKAKHTLLFSVEKTPKTPIMIRPRQFPQQANHWPPNHPPRPPGSYQTCIAALGDIICLLFDYSSTAQPPGKAAHLPCLQPIQLFTPNLHILCVLSAYGSAMFCVWNEYERFLRVYETHIIQILFDD